MCSIQTHHHLKTQIITSKGKILSHNLRFNSLLRLSTLLSESCIFSAQVANKTSHDNCNLKAWIFSPVSTVTFPPLDLKCQSHQKMEHFWNVFLSLTFWTARKCFPANCACLQTFCTQSYGRGIPPLAENEQILFFSFWQFFTPILVTWDYQSLPLVEHRGSYGLVNKCQSPENITFAFWPYLQVILPPIHIWHASSHRWAKKVSSSGCWQPHRHSWRQSGQRPCFEDFQQSVFLQSPCSPLS